MSAQPGRVFDSPDTPASNKQTSEVQPNLCTDILCRSQGSKSFDSGGRPMIPNEEFLEACGNKAAQFT